MILFWFVILSKEGQFFVHITNESWFWRDSCTSLIFIDERVPRCANTGSSCFIDPCTMFVDRVMDKPDKKIYVQDALARLIELYELMLDAAIGLLSFA